MNGFRARPKRARPSASPAFAADESFEDRGAAEHAGVEEFEDRPEFAQVIFDGRAAHRQAVSGLQESGGLGGLGGRGFDRLRLVEDDVIEFELAEFDNVGAEGSVGGENKVEFVEAIARLVPGGTGIVEDAQVGSEPGRFLSPVEDERSRDDDQGRAADFAEGFSALQEGKDLDGLAQSHVVGKDAAEVKALEVVEPAQALALIGAEFAFESFGRGECSDSFEALESLADAIETGVNSNVGLRPRGRRACRLERDRIESCRPLRCFPNRRAGRIS